MLRTGSSRIAALGAALLLVGGGLLAGSAGAAAAVDISLDFTAAAPLTYDHATGGGAFDNRSVGRAKDIVESLEGSDFRCGDVVTFLTHVHAGASVASNSTIEIDFEHLADTTGQAGVGFSEIVGARINAGDVGGEGPGGTDLGITGSGSSATAALVSSGLTAPLFTQKALLRSTVRIAGLNPGSSTVLRLDVRVACEGTARPTGNLQAAVTESRLVGPSTAPIRVGNQTIPFRMIANVTPAVYVEEAPPSTTVPPTPTTVVPSTACEITIDEEFVVAGVTPTVRIQGGTPGASVDVFVGTGTTPTPVTLDAAGVGIVPVPVPTDADVGSTVTVTVTNDPAGTCANSYTVLADTVVEPTTTTTAPETTVDDTIPDQPGPADVVIDVDVDNTGEDPEEDPAVDDTERTAECTQQGAVVYRGGVPLSGTSLPVGGSTRGRFALQVDPANGEVTCEFEVTGIPEGGTERVPINESELTVDVEEAGVARSNLPATGAAHGGLLALGGAAVGLGLVLTVIGRRRRATA